MLGNFWFDREGRHALGSDFHRNIHNADGGLTEFCRRFVDIITRFMTPEERTYRVTPKSVFDYSKYPKYVFIQDGPYRRWRYASVSDLLQKIQGTAHVTYEEWDERTANREPYELEHGKQTASGVLVFTKGQFDETKMLRDIEADDGFDKFF